MISSDPIDLETQGQTLPREDSIGSFTAGQPVKANSIAADRGLDCCCEVDVRLLLFFQHETDSPLPPSVKIQTAAGVTAADAGTTPGKEFWCAVEMLTQCILPGVWGP